MTGLADALPDYLELRRSLGHKMAEAAWLLPSFVVWMADTGQATITSATALEWAQLPDTQPGSTVWPRRMAVVRGFARYMSGIDPATEIPPKGLLPFRRRWRPPFIYTPADIAALLAAARVLPTTFQAATYETLLGLLAATGIRVGEALRLDCSDIDWEQGVILIRQSKYGKSRLVPVHPSTVHQLATYADRRQVYGPVAGNDSFFLSLPGRRLKYERVGQVFRQLISYSGIGEQSAARPRIHDLRHAFAVMTLLDWYHDGGDVAARLPWLSTYLGHHDPRSTYWYLSASPQLLAVAADRLEPYMAKAVAP